MNRRGTLGSPAVLFGSAVRAAGLRRLGYNGARGHRGVSAAVPAPPALVPFPSRLALASLLPILGLLPPETRGEALAGAAALAAVLAVLRWPAAAVRGRGLAAIVIGVALAALSARAGLAPAAAVEPVGLAVLAAAVGLAASTFVADRPFVLSGVGIAAAVGSAAAAHGVYQKLWGLERLAEILVSDPLLPDRAAVLRKLEAGRAFAGFATPAALGGFLALTLPLAIGLAAGSRGPRRAAWIVAAALQIAGLTATASVTAVVALAAAGLFSLLVWRRTRTALLGGLAALLILLAVVGIQRGGSLDPSDPAGPWLQRAANWRAALQVARDHPWLGVGPGGFAEASLAHRRPGDNQARHAHDLPLELAAETGWPGAVLGSAVFFALFLGPVWQERSRPSEAWRRAAAIGLASFALHNLADFTCFMPSILWTAAILRGFLARPHSMQTEHAADWLRATALSAVIVVALTAALSGLGRELRVAARAAAHAGDEATALDLATRAVRLAPWDIDAVLALAGATVGEAAPFRLPAERQTLALERAERAVRLAPTRSAARDLRARARLANGDLAGALADWEQAARFDPGRPDHVRARDAARRALAAVWR